MKQFCLKNQKLYNSLIRIIELFSHFFIKFSPNIYIVNSQVKMYSIF